MFWNKYPYTDNHELNLDWVIKKMSEVLKAADSIDDTVTDILNKWKDDGTLAALVYSLYFITPESVGAAGDGVTDDTEAFKTMVSKAVADRLMVYIPDNSYYLTDPVYISGEIVVSDRGTYTKRPVIVSDVVQEFSPVTLAVEDYPSILIKEDVSEYYWLQGAASFSDGTPVLLARDENSLYTYILQMAADYSSVTESDLQRLYHGNSCCIVNDRYLFVAPNVPNEHDILVYDFTTKNISSISITGMNNIHGICYDHENNIFWISCVSGTIDGVTGDVFAFKYDNIQSVVNGTESLQMVIGINRAAGGWIEQYVAAFPKAASRLYQNIFWAKNALYSVWTLRDSTNRNIGSMILRSDPMTGEITNGYYIMNPSSNVEIESVIIHDDDALSFDCIYNQYDSTNDNYRLIVTRGVLNTIINNSEDVEQYDMAVGSSFDMTQDGTYAVAIRHGNMVTVSFNLINSAAVGQWTQLATVPAVLAPSQEMFGSAASSTGYGIPVKVTANGSLMFGRAFDNTNLRFSGTITYML